MGPFYNLGIAGREISIRIKTGEFDPGSEQTLAACLTHASRTRKSVSADE